MKILLPGFNTRLLCLCIFYCCSANVYAAKVKTDFMEVFTGAGRGYPVFFVVERDESFQLLSSKADWVKIKSQQGQVGWVKYSDYVFATRRVKADLRRRAINSNWELGISAGSYGSDPSYSLGAGYYIKPNVAIQAEIKKVVGTFSHSNILGGQLMLQAFRDFIVHPFFAVGLARMQNVPRQSLVNASESQQTLYFYGAGVNFIPYKRLNLRVSIKNHYQNENKRSYLDMRAGVYALF